jgi:hypothetical protein
MRGSMADMNRVAARAYENDRCAARLMLRTHRTQWQMG